MTFKRFWKEYGLLSCLALVAIGCLIISFIYYTGSTYGRYSPMNYFFLIAWLGMILIMSLFLLLAVKEQELGNKNGMIAYYVAFAIFLIANLRIMPPIHRTGIGGLLFNVYFIHYYCMWELTWNFKLLTKPFLTIADWFTKGDFSANLYVRGDRKSLNRRIIIAMLLVVHLLLWAIIIAGIVFIFIGYMIFVMCFQKDDKGKPKGKKSSESDYVRINTNRFEGTKFDSCSTIDGIGNFEYYANGKVFSLNVDNRGNVINLKGDSRVKVAKIKEEGDKVTINFSEDLD